MRHAFLAQVLALAAAAIAAGTGAAAGEKSPMALVRTIALPGVKGRIDHMSLDAEGKRLAIACLGNGTVEVVDVEGGKVAGSIGRLREPQAALVLPGTGRIVVTNGDDGTVRYYDGKTLEIARTVELESDADNARFDAASGLLYVGYGNGAVAVIGKGGREADLRLAGHPESFQLEEKGKRIFVNVPTAKHVAVVDRAAGKVVATWPTGDAASNFPMALAEGSHRLFVGCRSPARLLVYDTASGKIVSTADISGDVDDIYVDTSGKRLYCSCGEGIVDVLDLSAADAWTRVAKVETAAGARTSLYDPATGRLFVAVPARSLPQAELRVYSTRP